MLCAEAILQYILGYATHGVDLKFFLVPFTYYFVLLLLSIQEKLRGELWQNYKHVIIHLRQLSILIFLLQRIPLTLLENRKINSVVLTVAVFGLTVILAEIVILISKKFKKIRLY